MPPRDEWDFRLLYAEAAYCIARGALESPIVEGSHRSRLLWWPKFEADYALLTGARRRFALQPRSSNPNLNGERSLRPPKRDV